MTSSNEYRVIKPYNLPKGEAVRKMLFFHGDLSARPYHLDDFVDGLAARGIELDSITTLGSCQMNHFWLCEVREVEDKEKILDLQDFLVKGKICQIFDPSVDHFRVKLLWLPSIHVVSNEKVSASLARYGSVTKIEQKRWKESERVSHMCGTARFLDFKLKEGVRVEDVPHTLHIDGFDALVVINGRAPFCLRCRLKGHTRRDCATPKCEACYKFGHAKNACPRSSWSAIVAQKQAPAMHELVPDDVHEYISDQDDQVNDKATPLASVKLPEEVHCQVEEKDNMKKRKNIQGKKKTEKLTPPVGPVAQDVAVPATETSAEAPPTPSSDDELVAKKPRNSRLGEPPSGTSDGGEVQDVLNMDDS